jgi:2-polyprenyl-3-methyl-5-hydroxy-6-metoxy-1,4-benzoquinol methylase
VGCSGGFFLAEFDKKFKKYGTEVELGSVEFARKHFPFGKNVYHTDILQAPFRKSMFDLITMRGVIEHVPDPVKVIRKCSSLLKPGGYFYITATPNGASFVADLFREQWVLFDPIAHIWHFSPETLARIAKRFGLKLIAKDFQYLGTPYENVKEDLKAVMKAMQLVKEGKRSRLPVSPPFWESMMTLVFQKQR